MTKKNEEENIQPVRVIFLGEARGTEGKIMHLITEEKYKAVDKFSVDDILQNSTSAFSVRKKKAGFNANPRAIGGIYIIDGIVGEENKLQRIRGDFKYTGETIRSNSSIAAFEGRAEAEAIAMRAEKLEKDQEVSDMLAKALDPLRRKWGATDSLGRLALEVLVLKKLRYG